jgi:hypothetical protein
VPVHVMESVCLSLSLCKLLRTACTRFSILLRSASDLLFRANLKTLTSDGILARHNPGPPSKG